MTAVTGHFDPAEADVIVGPVVCGDKQRGGNQRARAQPDGDRLREVRVATPSVISNRHRQLPRPTEIVPEPHGEKLSPDRRETLWERLLPLACGEKRPPGAGRLLQHRQRRSRGRFIAFEEPRRRPLLIGTQQANPATRDPGNDRCEDQRACDVPARHHPHQPSPIDRCLREQAERPPWHELEIVKVPLVKLDGRGAGKSDQHQYDEACGTWTRRADHDGGGRKRHGSRHSESPQHSGPKTVRRTN